MGSMSRNKGLRFEREVELIFQGYGLSTDRNIGGRLQDSGDIAVRFTPEPFAVEARRHEKPSVPRWVEEHKAKVPEGQLPMVVWRRNREEVNVAMSLDRFLGLITNDNPVRW